MDEVSRQKNNNLHWRVKVYLLNGTGNWDECGTGDFHLVKDKLNGEEMDFLQVSPCENDEEAPPVVSSEKLQKIKSYRENENHVLYRPLLRFNEFQKQGGKVVHQKRLIFERNDYFLD